MILSILYNNIFLAIKNLKAWMKPEYVEPDFANRQHVAKILREPLGVVLIIGAWNYPIQLIFNPLVGALAAGRNTLIIM